MRTHTALAPATVCVASPSPSQPHFPSSMPAHAANNNTTVSSYPMQAEITAKALNHNNTTTTTTTTPPADEVCVGATLFNGQYKVLRRLGNGTFGDVYEAQYLSTGASVAIKVARSPGHIVQMKKEAQAYQHCRTKSPAIRLPHLHWAGPCGNVHIMIMELLGDDLHVKQQAVGGTFSDRTLSQLAGKMLDLLQTLHRETRCIHKDVKPANFAMSGAELYMLDLGFTRPWVDEKGQHIAYDLNAARFIGTPRFASRSSHRGVQSSRRDDLESLVYTLVQMLKGVLPWSRIKTADQVLRCKDECAANPSLLTGGHPFITPFFDHVLKLQFMDEPNYEYLKGLVAAWVKASGGECGLYDWDVVAATQQQQHAVPVQVVAPMQQVVVSRPIVIPQRMCGGTRRASFQAGLPLGVVVAPQQQHVTVPQIGTPASVFSAANSSASNVSSSLGSTFTSSVRSSSVTSHPEVPYGLALPSPPRVAMYGNMF